MTEQKERASPWPIRLGVTNVWIEEVTKDFMEIGYTRDEANSLAWAKFFELAPQNKG